MRSKYCIARYCLVENTETCLVDGADGLGWLSTPGSRLVLVIIIMLGSRQVRGTCIFTLKFSFQILERIQGDQ